MKPFAVLLGMLFVAALAIPLGSARPPDGCTPGDENPLRNLCAGAVRYPAALTRSPAAPLPAPRYGAFSLARPPSFRFGFAVGQPSRDAAREAAEAGCRAASRGCSQIVEFTDSCISVTEGVKRVALIMTSDPRTFEVRGIDFGTASNPADAQHAAMRECRARERGVLNCRVLQTVCGPR